MVLTTEQYEELTKHNVFAGINITYTMRDGNYIIKLTNEEYEIYLKNRRVAGPMTSMQYNITMAAGRGWVYGATFHLKHLSSLKLYRDFLLA